MYPFPSSILLAIIRHRDAGASIDWLTTGIVRDLNNVIQSVCGKTDKEILDFSSCNDFSPKTSGAQSHALDIEGI